MTTPAADSPSPALATQRNVLVVEDHEDMRDALVEILRLEGYRVSWAADGRQALAEARLHRPDVILLDLMMPEMNGWQFRAEQSKDPELSVVPVIVMSAYASDMDAAATLPKPFLIEDMLETVRQFIQPP
ncbi:MAG TPA: response regulator [Anaeromyxobacteraceae bacterium]|nr:response regulator [Anaeromyxobacteraceae bacterium]